MEFSTSQYRVFAASVCGEASKKSTADHVEGKAWSLRVPIVNSSFPGDPEESLYRAKERDPGYGLPRSISLTSERLKPAAPTENESKSVGPHPVTRS